MTVALSFLGAAGTVTGSRFLLAVGRRRYLVDAGLFQGGRALRQRNWDPFPIDPTSLDGVLLTHAHIDHTGYLPRLVRQGYRGPVYATEATCALLEILLPDSAHLQEQDAAYANKSRRGQRRSAQPLYTVRDARETLTLLRPVPFDRPLELPSLRACWRPAGHILGSAVLEVTVRDRDGDRRLVFSGDLGRYDDEIMASPTSIPEADYLLVESTYGNRSHREGSIEEALVDVVKHVVERQGVLLIPAFTVGRTQQVLYHLRKLEDAGRIPRLPVYIDSPMAVDVSHLYCRYGEDHNLDVDLLMDDGACPLRCRRTHFVREVEGSKALNQMPGPAVVISAPGMCTGGRILHHLKWRLPDPANAVLFVGYQAEGTRGRQLLEGVRKLRIHGEKVVVRARIASVDALSAHGDREDLLRWLSAFRRPPRRTFVVHGEEEARAALARELEAWGWAVETPEFEESYLL